MSVAAARRRGPAGSAGAILVAILLLIWTLAPLYNMVLVAVQEKEDVFSSNIWPPHPTLHAFETVVTESYWYIASFWPQMGNSLFIGVAVAVLTLLIGSATSFAIMRLRIRLGWLLTNAALLTYVIPMSFLAIPFYNIMNHYGLVDTRWAVIAIEVTFATPYAIFIFSQYSASIPRELDEFRADRWRQSGPDLLAHLLAPDGAGASCGRNVCAVAGLERVSLRLFAALVRSEADSAGRARQIPEQRRSAMELPYGGFHHLRPAAVSDLLHLPPLYDSRVDDGRREGLRRLGRSR